MGYLYRAIDAENNLVDSRLSERRDMGSRPTVFNEKVATTTILVSEKVFSPLSTNEGWSSSSC